MHFEINEIEIQKVLMVIKGRLISIILKTSEEQRFKDKSGAVLFKTILSTLDWLVKHI